jgi:hypothetical protein
MKPVKMFSIMSETLLIVLNYSTAPTAVLKMRFKCSKSKLPHSLDTYELSQSYNLVPTDLSN